MLIKNNAAAYACAAVLFCFILYLYVQVVPVLPWTGDDWVYLSQFRDMFPSLSRWNPSRIFPEVLHPLVGWLTAVIYAWCGDYAQALIWSHALLQAVGITALALALYHSLRGILLNAGAALFGVAFFTAVSFSLFKSGPQSVFLFHSTLLTVSTHYVAPNLLNSILICYLLYGCAAPGGQYALRPDSLRAGGLILIIFSAQFSMTYGSAAAAVFAGWICVWRLWQRPGTLRQKITAYAREGTFFDAVLLLIMICWLLAAVLDVCGGRYGRIQQSEWAFAAAWNGFTSLTAQINTLPLVVTALLTLGAAARFAYKRFRRAWNADDSLFFGLFCICLLSAVPLLGLNLLISARATPANSDICVSYNIFFCLILGVTLNVCYLLRDMPRLYLLGPLVLALLAVECQNAEKPWARQSRAEQAVVLQWLDDVRKAEVRGDTAVTITVPKAQWPHPGDTFGKFVSNTLFAHGFTKQAMTVHLREAGQ